MQIESVKGTPAKQAPFGKGPKEALLNLNGGNDQPSPAGTTSK
jgi:hypothetical protein